MAVDIEQIKKIVIIALASDDLLMETLVLKGGNAIGFLQPGTAGVALRSSFDIDFSIADDFDGELDAINNRVRKTLENTFNENGLQIFDYKFLVKPQIINANLKDFWGGYNIEFKIATLETFKSARSDMEKLRRSGAIAILPNHSPKFEIEISKHEYVAGKVETQVDGYKIFIYSAEMMAFEKLRAICQQLPAYREIVSSRSSRSRPRDFYDIYVVMEQHHIDPSTPENKKLIALIFEAKKVPLDFIREIAGNLDMHKHDWQSVLDTIPAGEKVENFEYYADYVIKKFGGLTFP